MNDIYETRCKGCRYLYMGKTGCYFCGDIGCAIDIVTDEDCAKLNEEAQELKMNMEDGEIL